MRVLAFFLLWTMTAGAASASSFVVLAPLKDKTGPSIVVVGLPVAMNETTAALADESAPNGIDPMVTLSYPFVESGPPRDITTVAAPAVLRQISPSVLAMDMPPPPAKKVAALEPKSHSPFSLPMVIRGGIIGDAFATPSAEQPADAAATPDVASGPGNGGSGGVAGEAPEAPSAPAPAPPPPAMTGPTRQPE